MKRTICSILTVILLLSFGKQVGAVETEIPSLSPAIDILKEKSLLLKGNLSGSRINFSTVDFIQVLGKEDFGSITIESLPAKSVGSLVLFGLPVSQGQTILKKELGELCFIPSGQAEEVTTFTFSTPGSQVEHCCKIYYASHENTPPKSENINVKTYRNVAVFSQIKWESSGDVATVRILEGCRNGILTLNEKTGSFTYRPETNFTGIDRFRYQVVDDYGNTSPVMTAKIKVSKAEKNLYFYDCAENPNHANAIFVCEKGLMNYTLDENGLPVFSPEEKVDFDFFLKAATSAMNIQDETSLESMKAEKSDLTLETAASILCQILKQEDRFGLPVINMTDHKKLSAVETLEHLGILGRSEDKIFNQSLNKSDCAALLSGMVQFRDKNL